MGYDWHPDCLKCEECGKVLKPGQHAEVQEIIDHLYPVKRNLI